MGEGESENQRDGEGQGSRWVEIGGRKRIPVPGRAIRELNGREEKGKRLVVKESQFKRDVAVEGNGYQNKTNRSREQLGGAKNIENREVMKFRKEQKSYKSVLLNQKEYERKDKTQERTTILGLDILPGEIKGVADRNIMALLGRAIVGESAIPLLAEEVIPSLFRDWHTLMDVKLMGSFKMLLIFDEVNNMIKALNSSFLLNYFGEIRKWSEYEVNRSRETWIEVFGLPLHAWCEENIHKIASVWGTVIKVEDMSMKKSNLNSVRALVDTSTVLPINNKVTMEVERVKYLIYVKETWKPEVNIEEQKGGKLKEDGDKDDKEHTVEDGRVAQTEGQKTLAMTEGNDVARRGSVQEKINEGSVGLKEDQSTLPREKKRNDDMGDFLDAQQMEKNERGVNSNSTRCLPDDRDSLEVIMETQLGPKMDPEKDGPIILSQNEDESISGPFVPPGFESNPPEVDHIDGPIILSQNEDESISGPFVPPGFESNPPEVDHIVSPATTREEINKTKAVIMDPKRNKGKEVVKCSCSKECTQQKINRERKTANRRKKTNEMQLRKRLVQNVRRSIYRKGSKKKKLFEEGEERINKTDIRENREKIAPAVEDNVGDEESIEEEAMETWRMGSELRIGCESDEEPLKYLIKKSKKKAVE
ncbi:hypothetical protein PIB30_043605 [Stylosanthes scabra]|uniref:DUF4283 domain-containing protein n=1 Tax=Stylosanthes scabra TaxID=79078 RepID=A0ABU6TFX3_9FABA|nr:hypothetical protein [Stylosanthes scabra]